jgi:response regulator RpfG family c-di-GMP phosphodiesterase
MVTSLLRILRVIQILYSHYFFVTAISNEQKYLSKAYDLGAIDFLSKPLNTEITRKKVASFLKIWDYDQELKKTK